MSIHIHHLRGCAPAPLAHYLKALGILRLVAEQVDPEARLWWQDEHACLATTLDEAALIAFFADTYRPTPMVAPWNGGSGFYPKDNRIGPDAIVAQAHPRFSDFKAAILAARQQVGALEESPKEEEKAKLISTCRATWRGGLARWIATAVVIDQDLSARYPALLGTGGNDGRLDFTNNFMQRLTELVGPDGRATATARGLLGAALMGHPARGLIAGKAIGQFLPGCAGGANSTTGFDADSLLNPWDFVLMLEGAVLWTAAAARRLGTSGASMVTAPFALRAQSAGHGSAASGEDAPRGEQWMPLWPQAAGFNDIAALLAEGRLTTTQGPAQRPIDAARAIARLGTARGITAFQRYGYLERNGQANLAIPLGRWQVLQQPHMDLIDHAAAWIDRLSRAARGDGAPAAWTTAVRVAEEALLTSCRSPALDDRQRLLLALGAAEAAVARVPAKARDAGLRPLARLPTAWLHALPNSPELRLAVAIASQIADPPLRRHWLTPDGLDFAKRPDVEVVATTGSFVPDAVAILRRRCRQAGVFALAPRDGHGAGLADLAYLLGGLVDAERLWSLVRPLLALDWQQAEPLPAPATRREDAGRLALCGLIRLNHAPQALAEAERPLAVDPALISRLLAGDGPGALRIAARRLSAIGLRPHLSTASITVTDARQVVASLIVPLTPSALRQLAVRLTRPDLTP